MTADTQGAGISQSGDIVALTLPARPEYVGLCRLALAGLGQSLGLDLETVADLKVAISEGCSWSIRNSDLGAEQGTGTGSIQIEIEVNPDLWTITVGWRNTGLARSRKEEELFSEDDLALTVIRALVDEFQLMTTDGGHSTLVMTKRLA